MSADPGLARRAAAVAAWLRAHPDVEAGPSVRASIAFADLAGRWQELTGSDGLLPPALLALPHRMRVRPGADADELVRLALLETSGVTDPAPPDPVRSPGGGTREEEEMADLVAMHSRGHTPG
ncbi:MAG: hypothetical protein ACRD0O_03300, partial [Acidimicrobiia bacterium]